MPSPRVAMPRRRPSPLPARPRRPAGPPDIDPEVEREIRAQHLGHGDDLSPEFYPTLHNLSAAFMYRFMVRPKVPRPIEYVRIPIETPPWETDDATRNRYYRVVNFIAQWNYAWEAGHLRHEMRADNIPDALTWLTAHQDVNLCLVPDEGHRSGYDLYQSLYHLLPRRTLERFGLPLFKMGHWPVTVPDVWADRMLPSDADRRLERAFAAHVWPLLSPGSRIDAFSADDPVRLLAHNLDFWLPHVDAVATARMDQFPRVEVENDEQQRVLDEARTDAPDDTEIHRPLKGGPVWEGEADAWEATRELVEQADRGGRLRALIDAIRSHRVEEDFSDRWSFAREDFERRLHAKRVRRVKISFVELGDTTPVHGREAEVHEQLLWEDFLAIVEPRERRIVVCLRNGMTRVGDIASELGYANHSPVSKALAKIRKRAERYLRD